MDQSQLFPRFAVVASTQKLADRFLFTGSLPTNTAAHINLLYSLEVTRPWFPSSRLVPTITNVLSQRFNTIKKSSNPLKSFEATVKNINEELYAIAEQGETEWVGHFNSLLVLVIGNQVHISQTGNSTAYLFRQRKISQVTEATDSQAEPHPLSTFSNIVSGQLIEGDRMIFSNQDLFSLVSLDQIRAAVTDQTPYLAANQLVKNLKRTSITSVSSIILAIESQQTWEEAGEEPIFINLEESLQSWYKQAWKKTKPVLKQAQHLSIKAWQYTKTGAKSAHHKWQTSYGPKTKQALQRGAVEVNKLAAKAGSYTKKTVGQAQQKIAGPSIQQKGEDWVITKLTPVHKKLRPVLVPVKRELKKVDREIARLVKLIKPKLSGKNFRYVLIVVVIILLFSVLVSVRNRHNSQLITQKQDQNDIILAEVQELAGKADTALELQQKVEAQNHLNEAQKKLAQIESPNSNQGKERDSLIKIIQEKGDKLTNTRRIAAAATYTVPKDTDIIVAASNGIFTWSTKSKTGRHLARDLSQSEQEFSFEQDEDKPISARYDRERDEILVFTTSKRLYGVRRENENISITRKENPLGDFAEAQVVATYGQNLYLMDINNSLLWKYSPSGDNFNRGINQIEPNQVSLNGAVDLAIDGYIYILHQNGTIDRLLRGEKTNDFAVSGVPELPTKSNFLAISASDNSDLIHLLDIGDSNQPISGARMIMLNKDGTFASQVAFTEQLNNIKSATFEDINKTFWILNDQTIFEYRL